MKGKQIHLWYSGKAHEHGGNIQALSASAGLLSSVSDWCRGSHDLTAALNQVLGALYWAASQPDLKTEHHSFIERDLSEVDYVYVVVWSRDRGAEIGMISAD